MRKAERITELDGDREREKEIHNDIEVAVLRGAKA